MSKCGGSRKKIDNVKVKKIIADYIELENYAEVARRNDVSRCTVKNYVKACDDDEELKAVKKKLEDKHAEETNKVFAYMDTKCDAVCEIIGMYLDELKVQERIDKSTCVQLATSVGILVDKFTMAARIRTEAEEKKADTASEIVVKYEGGDESWHG